MLYFLLVTASILYAPLCRAGFTGEFLLFPQLNSVFRADLDDHSVLDKNDQVAGADFFVTFETDQFRFLGEYVLSTDEQDVERFQLGWLFKSHIFWLGRFHNPIGYWNTSYHHGAYLQVSISRPAAVEYEEMGGILPVHQAGLLVEGTFDFAEQELGYALAFAAGPEFTDELVPWDVLKPGSGSRDTSVTLNVYRDFGPKTPGRLGLFANSTIIPARTIGVSEIQQFSSGIYASGEFDRWRWHGSALYVHNQFQSQVRPESAAFFNAYLQVEYILNHSWLFYGRMEGTIDDADDTYLALFPKFVQDRMLGGIRYDFAQSNALKFEVSSNHLQEDDFTQVMLQWSAMF